MINHYLENVDDTFKLWKIDFNIDMKNSTKKELINIFNEILENKPYQVVLVLTLMILKAHINL
jgi:hypothetical protein